MSSKESLNLLVFSILLSLLSGVLSLPDGAPSKTCTWDRPHTPKHGNTTFQSLETFPYLLRATTDKYNPGTQMQITIQGIYAYFRGFYLQARDLDTDEWIGTFQMSPNTKLISECKAITHSDPKDKIKAVINWKATDDKLTGRVYFTGTIVKDKKTYWSHVIAQVPAPIKKFQFGDIL